MGTTATRREAGIEFTPSEVAAYYRVRLSNLKQRGAEWRGPCPVHRGKRDSFAMDPKTGRAYCHSQCARGWDLIGFEQELTGADFKAARAQVFGIVGRPMEPERRIVATYQYTDQAGKVLFECVRYEPKGFRQRRPDGRGGYIWNLKGVRSVLYRLSAVLEAETVHVCEGEKDVATLESFGLTATCNPMGADKWRPDYAQCLRGKHVIIIPDNDEAGRRHAAVVAQSVLGLAATVRIVELPRGKDATDWVRAGGTLAELQKLVQAAPLLNAGVLEHWRARWNLREHKAEADTKRGSGATEAEAPWQRPKPLSATLPEVERFDPGMLPESLRTWVVDIAERLQVPLDFVAATAMVALAGVIGRRAVIRPKQFDDWEVVSNLWGGIVGRPGLMKSPCIRAVLKILRKLQAKAVEAHKAEVEEYERDLAAFEIRKAAWKAQSTVAAKKGSAFLPFDEQPPENPHLVRYIVNDATLEKLHAILEENPQGVLYVRDELVGWLATLDTEGRGRDRPFFLEAWNGDGSYTIDRIGRGTLHVENLCLSIFGGIQPAKLQCYLTDAVTGGASDDGLAQRLQLLVWPDPSPDWEDVDRLPDFEAERRVEEIIRRIVTASPASPFRARFSPEAQQLFSEWRSELENRIRREAMPPVLESHLAKYRSLMPSLALILHLAEGGEGEEIPLLQAQRAADWCTYLESHARRVYSCVVSLSNRIAATLADKLKAGALGTRFTVRAVYRSGWSGLDTPELARRALGILEDTGWVRKVPSQPDERAGRPGETYIVNPEVWHE